MGSGDHQEDLNPLERFGLEVREVRTGRKLTQRQLGKATGYSNGYVSKVEAGTLMPSQKFARGCDVAFGTNGLFTRLLRNLEEGDHPSWFVPYLELERKAARILDFSATSIMGMLQTEDYARAIFRAGNPKESEEVINGKVAARIRRREVLTQERPPRLWVVLHEACLRTLVGGRAVMAKQLEHLVHTTKATGVDLQVIPYSAGEHAGHTLAFTLLVLKDSSTVLYADDVPHGGRLYRSAASVGPAVDTYDRLRAYALAPDESVSFIKTIHKEYAREREQDPRLQGMDQVVLQRLVRGPVRRGGPRVRPVPRRPRPRQ